MCLIWWGTSYEFSQLKSACNCTKILFANKFASSFTEDFDPTLTTTKNWSTMIITQSNLHSDQKGTRLDLKEAELRVVLRMLILIGLNTLPSIRLYWSTDTNFRISRIMYRCNAHEEIFENIAFLTYKWAYKNRKERRSRLRQLCKVRSTMKILKNSLLAVSNPRGNLSVDESMVASSGKKRLKQYMPLKPIKKVKKKAMKTSL